MNDTTTTEYETRTEVTCWRYGPNREYRARTETTYQVPVGTARSGIAIPKRETGLDMSKLAEVQAWANQITSDLS